MLPLVFIGGAVTGAAGLLAAALWDKKKTEAQFSPTLKTPESLDAKETAKQLNSYFFKAQGLYSKCNKIIIESSELISTPIPLPDDNILEKAGVILGGKANKFLRGWRESELRDIQKEMQSLFKRYKRVFTRANSLLESQGKNRVDLSGIKFVEPAGRIDRALENDNWDRELGELADAIREFIEESCKAAEQMIDMLEQESKPVPAIRE